MKNGMFGLALIMMFSVFAPARSKAANQFVCSCQAVGPGVERDHKSVQKYCSYKCDCIAIKEDHSVVMSVPAKIQNVATTAYSLESWDYKSQICHGQYSWKPNLNDATWKTQVRFAPFKVTTDGTLIFPERIEIAQGINEEGKAFKTTAPEVAEALRTLMKPVR